METYQIIENIKLAETYCKKAYITDLLIMQDAIEQELKRRIQ